MSKRSHGWIVYYNVHHYKFQIVSIRFFYNIQALFQSWHRASNFHGPALYYPISIIFDKYENDPDKNRVRYQILRSLFIPDETIDSDEQTLGGTKHIPFSRPICLVHGPFLFLLKAFEVEVSCSKLSRSLDFQSYIIKKSFYIHINSMSAERKVSVSPTIRYGLAILVSSYSLKKINLFLDETQRLRHQLDRLLLQFIRLIMTRKSIAECAESLISSRVL